MKFLVAFAVIALASGLVSARGSLNKRNIGLTLDGGLSSYTNVLAREIAPLLLQRQPLINYQAPIAAQAVQVAAAPQIFSVALQPQIQQQWVAQQQQSYGPIQAAVLSRRNVQFIDVPSSGAVAPAQSIVIGPSIQPLDLEFQSQSSPVSVRQVHIPGQANPPQFSSHTDQADLLKQEIVKPIIHEVTEAIQPIRTITQEVRPVQETINQILTRGQQVQQQVAVQAVQAVQAVPVQAVATVEAAPVINTIETAPIATANIVNTVNAVPVNINSVGIQDIGLQGLNLHGGLSGFSSFAGGLRALPVNARITRF